MPGSLVNSILLLSLCSLIYQHQAAAHDLDGSVIRMSADGSNVERMSGVGAAAPIWAPDGQRILYVLHTEDELGSSCCQRLGRTDENSGSLADHGRGRRILVFTTNRDGNLELYLADGDGRNLRNLTRREGFDARPSWFPDGRGIAF